MSPLPEDKNTFERWSARGSRERETLREFPPRLLRLRYTEEEKEGEEKKRLRHKEEINGGGRKMRGNFIHLSRVFERKSKKKGERTIKK